MPVQARASLVVLRSGPCSRPCNAPHTRSAARRRPVGAFLPTVALPTTPSFLSDIPRSPVHVHNTTGSPRIATRHNGGGRAPPPRSDRFQEWPGSVHGVFSWIVEQVSGDMLTVIAGFNLIVEPVAAVMACEGGSRTSPSMKLLRPVRPSSHCDAERTCRSPKGRQMNGDQAPRGERPGAGQPVTLGEHGHGEASLGHMRRRPARARGQSVRCTPAVLWRDQAQGAQSHVSGGCSGQRQLARRVPSGRRVRTPTAGPGPGAKGFIDSAVPVRAACEGVHTPRRQQFPRGRPSGEQRSILPVMPGLRDHAPRFLWSETLVKPNITPIVTEPETQEKGLQVRSGKVFTFKGRSFHSHQNPRVSALSSHFRRSSRPRSLRFNACS